MSQQCIVVLCQIAATFNVLRVLDSKQNHPTFCRSMVKKKDNGIMNQGTNVVLLGLYQSICICTSLFICLMFSNYYASKDSSSSALKTPQPSQNTMQAQLMECLQDRIDSLEWQLNEKQHVIELRICEPATRKIHGDDTSKRSGCEINSNSQSSNKGKFTVSKNTSIVEESIFSDISNTIKNKRAETIS